MIIAVSDVHLGYNEKCNKKEFNEFIDELAARDDVTDLVICGDFLDMWRRDIAGVVFENADTLAKLQNLQPETTVHYVVGNHDYYLKDLKNDLKKVKKFDYQFEFHEKLTLPYAGKNYRFVHGYDLDDIQKPAYFIPMCYTTDELGDLASEAWKMIMSKEKLWKRITGIGRKEVKNKVDEMSKDAKERMTKDIIDKVEKKALASVKEGEVLIFGHTHEAFVHKSETLANCGTWESDGSPQNTYVEIDDGKLALKVFRGEEITERLDF